MVITVFGLGFVGLTTSLGFAKFGHKVYGVDINNNRIQQLKQGIISLQEPYLADELSHQLNKNFFPFDYGELGEALSKSEAIFYCVGTPHGKNGYADLAQLKQAISDTIINLPTRDDIKFRALVIKSTVPPSTTEQEIIPLVKDLGGDISVSIGVGNNPEFLREGHCWEDFCNADRIVIGVDDKKTEMVLRNAYSNLPSPVYCVSLNTAEFIKYLSNLLLATLISYANEMTNVADEIGGIDVRSAFNILHKDKRWNNAQMAKYVYPGCGYGGYCLPKDTNAFWALSKKFNQPANLLEQVIRTNDAMPEKTVSRIVKNISDKSACIGVLGLSFKPDSIDVRDTPSYHVITGLQRNGYNNLIAYDPLAMEEFRRAYPDIGISYADSYADILQKGDAFVILTAWKAFEDILLKTNKNVIDCRYYLNP